jgi:hypothetical protein
VEFDGQAPLSATEPTSSRPVKLDTSEAASGYVDR